MSSITPDSGWNDSPPPRKSTSQPAEPQPTGFYPRCKVCDRGSLVTTKMFRMSGPVVAIGFILLIPSVLGMIFSALIFVGVISYNGDESGNIARRPDQPFQGAFDAGFRRSCAKSFRQNYQLNAGVPAPLPVIVQYCECALSVFKETGSQPTAIQTCVQGAKEGSLNTPSQEVQALYSDETIGREKYAASAATNLLHVIGSGFAIGLGIVSFVGGLLGWLLVMRKRVLQCSLCRAVVNAS
jgi:hypothetical protein